MATLTASDLQAARSLFEVLGDLGLDKPRMNAMIQAIENQFTSAAFQSAMSTAIDAATAPVVLTATQKRQAVVTWLRVKELRGGQ